MGQATGKISLIGIILRHIPLTTAPNVSTSTSTSMTMPVPLSLRDQGPPIQYCNDDQPYDGYMWWTMLFLSLILLSICALLAGLTLAVCSTDLVWLHILTQSGTALQRQQATVVSRMRRRGSWLLCSLILCSVACGETLPIIIQRLFPGEFPDRGMWSIIASTVAIAFFAELVPQYVIPRRPIQWAYYTWPLIWFCMYLTFPLSWSISYCLNRICGKEEQKGLYTRDQLAIFIRFLETTEKHGGDLTTDISRVMRGALELDKRVAGPGESPASPHDQPQDIEKGPVFHHAHPYVHWRQVKTIDIDEEVTPTFLRKIKGWAYSRFPVVSKHELDEQNDGEGGVQIKIYGFLHTKNLIGKIPSTPNGHRLFVRDLILYPLPIIREDMALYDLLHMFQLGMSRMAVVVGGCPDTAPLVADGKRVQSVKHHAPGAPLWNNMHGILARDMHEADEIDSRVEWTTDYLEAAQRSSQLSASNVHIPIAMGQSEPLGIITYEDIVDLILQKTSRDEKDFYDRCTFNPPTKSRKEGDYASISSTVSSLRVKRRPSSWGRGGKIAFGPLRINGLWQRSISKGKNTKEKRVSIHQGEPARAGLDGADDRLANYQLDHGDGTVHTGFVAEYRNNAPFTNFKIRDNTRLRLSSLSSVSSLHLSSFGKEENWQPSVGACSLRSQRHRLHNRLRMRRFRHTRANTTSSSSPQYPRLRRVRALRRQARVKSLSPWTDRVSPENIQIMSRGDYPVDSIRLEKVRRLQRTEDFQLSVQNWDCSASYTAQEDLQSNNSSTEFFSFDTVDETSVLRALTNSQKSTLHINGSTDQGNQPLHLKSLKPQVIADLVALENFALTAPIGPILSTSPHHSKSMRDVISFRTLPMRRSLNNSATQYKGFQTVPRYAANFGFVPNLMEYRGIVSNDNIHRYSFQRAGKGKVSNLDRESFSTIDTNFGEKVRANTGGSSQPNDRGQFSSGSETAISSADRIETHYRSSRSRESVCSESDMMSSSENGATEKMLLAATGGRASSFWF